MTRQTPLWSSQTLLTPAAIHLILEVGLVPHSDHLQVQYTISSATDGVMLAMESSPHRPVAELRSETDRMLARALAEVEGLTSPF